MSQTPYGFDAALFRAARTAAGATVPHIARTARVSERAVSLYLAGTRTPRPGVMVLLAQAVGAEPADLCTAPRETLRHLRIFTGRSRAQMGRHLGMSEATYRELENTGARGRLAGSRYSPREGRWLPWEEWAAPKFATTPDRLAAAEEHTRAEWQAERERRWQQLSEADPARAARIEELGRLGRPLRDR
ncbi:helix-turn-helix domain-containing protein [Streptomyces sp. NPDC090077]|uniref:helix-turn-helix domain-containing protein n=1 Tax=Streptomyces sp. NPDC090077 TaxID=3365938 RepID=UPI00381D87CF